MSVRSTALARLGVVPALVCACAARPPTPPPPPTADTSPPEPSPDPRPPCAPAATFDAERLALSTDAATTTSSGLQVHFVGESFDHFDDGSFALNAVFQFAWGAQQTELMMSALGPPHETASPVLGHCVRFVAMHDNGAVVEVAELRAGPTLPVCGDDPPAHAGLERFASVDEDKQFSTTLAYDEDAHQWAIAPMPQIPRHHAVRVEWENLASMGRQGLGRARDKRVRVAIRFGRPEITVVGQRQWRSTYYATIESACVLE